MEIVYILFALILVILIDILIDKRKIQKLLGYDWSKIKFYKDSGFSGYVDFIHNRKNNRNIYYEINLNGNEVKSVTYTGERSMGTITIHKETEDLIEEITDNARKDIVRQKAKEIIKALEKSRQSLLNQLHKE